MNSSPDIRLTQYSHGAGCGCKIAPAVLSEILAGIPTVPHDDLLVGNDRRDDAGALDLHDGRVLLSTTDFFMPIVDDPFTAILGWPTDKLAPQVAGDVLRGARQACADAGCALAGGHSIDSPEPIFGLAVSGLVERENLKRNGGAEAGDALYLTKPLGIGITSTARKRGLFAAADEDASAVASMCRLNDVGRQFAELDGVHAMTDVTGFGLLGHLLEMCDASDTGATLDVSALHRFEHVDSYLDREAIPGGTRRNLASYGERVDGGDQRTRLLLADPQTSGGLLIAVAPDTKRAVESVLRAADLALHAAPIGRVEAAPARVVIADG
jgi:selenide,water dikinase